MAKRRRLTGVLPQTMRAAVIDRFGGPEVFSVRSMPLPKHGSRDVLIALHTVGVASWDADMREGWSPTGRKPRFPMILGTDGSGIVAAVGSLAHRFKRGDEVIAYDFNRAGFYAQYVSVRANKTGFLPKTLDLGQAGAMTCTGLTALQGIDDTLRLKRGDTIIVHGATGAVGSLALQFAKLRGARVLATGRAEKDRRFLRKLGADAAAIGRPRELHSAIRGFAPDGVDAILALVGGAGLEACLDGLRSGGRLAYPNGIEPAPKRRRGIKTLSYDGIVGVRELERLRRAVEQAKLVVPIAAKYPLAQVARAHRRLAAGSVRGKLVLRVHR
ncbi:MAG TPA: NADP-dependent oxidoreductase [Steroidobacteraceae bacterium]